MADDISTKIADLQEKLRLRYPAIEELVEKEDFAHVNKSFAAAYEELETLAKSGGLKKGKEARQAMKALERTMDLLAELLKLRYELAEQLKAERKPAR